MYNIEVNNRIKGIVKAFYRLGLWRINNADVPKIGWTYLIFYVLFVMSLISGGLLSHDSKESIYLIFVGIAASVVAVKLLYIICKKNEILVFIEDIGIHYVSDNEEFTTVNSKVKNLMNMSSSLFLFTCMTNGAFITSYFPVFSSENNLPLNVWLPFDWKNNPITYWIAYAFVAFGIIVSNGTTLLNLIIWYLMMNCAIKYQLIGAQIKNMIIPKKKKTSEEDHLFRLELIDSITSHRQVKETINRFKSCFGNIFFVQITTSGICICGSVYVLAFGTPDDNLFQRMFYFMLLLYHIFDIFMVMYFGNEIKLSSDSLSYCLFDWLERSKSNQICTIILTEILQRPHELVIGKLYPLNMQTFTSIVKLAYSMFNILKNLK